jgi:hypothetical protein
MYEWGGAGVCHAHAENDNHTDRPLRIELLDGDEMPINLEEINDGEA